MRRQNVLLSCLFILLITLASCGDNSEDNPANAGQDQLVTASQLIQLDASASKAASDPDAVYTWTQVSGPGVKIKDNNAQIASFTSPIGDAEKQLVFKLTITQSNGNTSTDTVTITVSPSSEPDRMIVGETMSVGDIKTSPSGEFELRFQEDGNWCIYRSNSFYWCSMSTIGSQRIRLLDNGQLLVAKLTADNEEVTSSCTAAHADVSRIQLHDDGTLLVYDTTGNTVDVSTLEFHSMNGDDFYCHDPVEHPDPLKRATSLPTPPAGFNPYYRKHLKAHELNILGTPSVEDRTMLLVQAQLNEMINALKSSDDIAMFDDATEKWRFVVMSEYDNTMQMPYMLTAYANLADAIQSVNFNARGFGGRNISLVTEEMVCRTGVPAATWRVPLDTNTRALDQVVHEFGHMIDAITGKRPYLDPLDGSNISINWVGSNSGEPFAWGAQYWFGHINGESTTSIDENGQERPDSQLTMRPDIKRYFESQFDTPASVIKCDTF